jgi:hypothetical protein
MNDPEYFDSKDANMVNEERDEKLDMLEIGFKVKIYDKNLLEHVVNRVPELNVDHKGVVITGYNPWILQLVF